MAVTLAILRGINVSGHRKIQMAGLKVLFQELGFRNVTTYIQSGNIVFENHQVPAAQLPALLAEKIQERYTFVVPVITRTAAEIENVLNQKPWPASEDLDKDKWHVTFLAELPAPEHLATMEAKLYEPDKFVVLGKEVFLYCPDGYGNTKLTNTFFEKKLKVTATTRNWRTINELSRIMQTY